MAWEKGSVRKLLLSFLIGVLCAATVLFFLRRARTQGPSTSTPTQQATEAPPPKEAAGIPKEDAPAPPKVRVYPKVKLAAKLDMPELATEPGEVVAVAEIPTHTGPTTSLAILDNVTGEARILTRREPRSFFGLDVRDLEIGGGIGIGAKAAEARAEWFPLRLGDVRFGVTGEVWTEPTGTVRGAGIAGFRWRPFEKR